MEYWLLSISLLLLVLLLRTQWQMKELNQKVNAGGEDRIRTAVEEVIRELLRSEFRASREELNEGLRGNRKELADSLTGFRKEMTEGQQALVKATEEKLEKVRLTVD